MIGVGSFLGAAAAALLAPLGRPVDARQHPASATTNASARSQGARSKPTRHGKGKGRAGRLVVKGLRP